MAKQNNSNYYVYGYFDPRNYELFYIGKGKDNRKNAHFPDKAGSATERRIADIEKADLHPNIKILATNLTEDEAYLVEKALIWRSGKSLTNQSGGKFAEKFRPPNTLHQSIPGFDTDRRIYFVNVGDHFDYDNRQWEDGCKYNFVAAGYGLKYSSQLDRLSVGDIVAAYLVAKDYKKRGHVGKSGFVGIGRVVAAAVSAADFRFNGRPLNRRMLKGPELLHHADDAKECEYLVGVKWIKKVPREDARFRSKAGFYVGRMIAVDYSNQREVHEFLEQQFGVNFEKLLAAD